MIQFNLLPDVKLEYIKARRTKHLVMLGSFIVTGISVALIAILFVGVNVLQKGHLDRLDKDIHAKTDQLKGEADIDKILTIQNQLKSLDGLHDSKPAANRLGGYLKQITPNEVSISEIVVDFSMNTMTIDGDAANIKAVNEFVDTLKFTKYEEQVEGQAISEQAFANVVLATFARTENQAQQSKESTTYQVTLNFSPAIFDITKSVKLNVPKNKITTRSVTERPEPLFDDNSGGEQ